MEIKIESGQLQTSKKSGKEYTNVKLSDGSYMNIWGNQLEHIGKKVNINEPTIFNNNKWTSIDKSKPEPKPEPQKHDGISKQEYLDELERIWSFTKKLEPAPEASVGVLAVCNTYLIAYTNGKIINDVEPDFETEPE